MLNDNPNSGGSPTDNMYAYLNYGVDMNISWSPLTFSQTQSQLNSGSPIHTHMYKSNPREGHSMTIRGYAYYASTYKTYSMIDPNKSYFVTVTAYSDGSQVCYNLNGSNYYWEYSIINFD